MIAPKILEEQATIEWLPVSEIGIDMEYQRSLSPGKVQGISKKFNPYAVGTLIVSRRDDGRLIVIDGQHRLEAMKKRGILLAECKVIRGLMQDQEAEIYVYCNKNRKNPEALDLFRAGLIAQDPVPVAINAIVEKCGLTIQFHPPGGTHTGGNRKRPPKCIWAVSALEEIYLRPNGGALLEEVLTLASRSWTDDGSAFEGKVLLALTKFHLQYKGQYVREEFIAKMQVTDLNAIRRRARGRYEVDGGSMVTAIAKAFQEEYDKHRRNRRLESKEHS